MAAELMSLFKYVLLFFIGVVSITNCTDFNLNMTNKTTTCTAKLEICTLEIANNAFLGEKGEKGEKGDTGPPGVCTCNGTEDTMSRKSKQPDGSLEFPYDKLCKDVKDKEGKKHFTYYFGSKNPIKVDCFKEFNHTCISESHNSTKTIQYGKEPEPFWLSGRGVSLQDLYHVSQEQVTILQEKSSEAFQKIKYVCRNSQPVPQDVNKSLMLFSWSATLIGPKPTKDSPYHYTIEYDGCSGVEKPNSEERLYSEILVKTDNPRTLPVRDFLISDIRGQEQEVEIINVAICFV